MAFPAVDSALGQVASQRLRDHFAHFQGRAGGGIDFMPVVAFNDLDIDLIAQHACGQFQ